MNENLKSKNLMEMEAIFKEMGQPKSFGTGGTWSVVDGENVYTPYKFKNEGIYHMKLTVNTDGYTANSNRFAVGFLKIGGNVAE